MTYNFMLVFAFVEDVFHKKYCYISFFPELSKEVIMQNFLLPKILDKNSLPLCHSCWSEWRPEQECFVSDYVNIS